MASASSWRPSSFNISDSNNTLSRFSAAEVITRDKRININIDGIDLECLRTFVVEGDSFWSLVELIQTKRNLDITPSENKNRIIRGMKGEEERGKGGGGGEGRRRRG